MITRPQYLKLKQIQNSNGTEAKDYDKNRDLYDYLRSHGYIKRHTVREYYGYTVTESGKVEMKLYRDDTHRFLITIFISFAALITSIISILLQTQPIQVLLTQ